LRTAELGGNYNFPIERESGIELDRKSGRKGREGGRERESNHNVHASKVLTNVKTERGEDGEN
jgi:hypothetical protein